jgi:AcrR family transcriptional regulator
VPDRKADRGPASGGGSRASGRKKQGVRLDGTERRAQIAEAAYRLMARHGLQGTTVARIAEDVGMEAPSLYAHYPDRHHMILAAIDVLAAKVDAHLSSSSNPNVLERLRAIAENHAGFMTEEFDGFVLPTFQIIAAPRDSGLAEVSGQKQQESLAKLAGFVEEGKRQGTIRQDVDSRVAAYEFMMLFWAEDVTRLMGIDEFVADGIAKKIMGLFLREMAVSQPDSTAGAVSGGAAESGDNTGMTPEDAVAAIDTPV